MRMSSGYRRYRLSDRESCHAFGVDLDLIILIIYNPSHHVKSNALNASRFLQRPVILAVHLNAATVHLDALSPPTH